jgi:hypothetical protein
MKAQRSRAPDGCPVRFERVPEMTCASETRKARDMKPSISILDQSFRYVSSIETSVADTWRRFGWRPTSAVERSDRLRKASSTRADQDAGGVHEKVATRNIRAFSR